MESLKRESDEELKIYEPVLVGINNEDSIRIDKDEVRNVLYHGLIIYVYIYIFFY